MTREARYLGWPRLVIAFPRLAAIYERAGEQTRAQLRTVLADVESELGAKQALVLLERRN